MPLQSSLEPVGRAESMQFSSRCEGERQRFARPWNHVVIMHLCPQNGVPSHRSKLSEASPDEDGLSREPTAFNLGIQD